MIIIIKNYVYKYNNNNNNEKNYIQEYNNNNVKRLENITPRKRFECETRMNISVIRTNAFRAHIVIVPYELCAPYGNAAILFLRYV